MHGGVQRLVMLKTGATGGSSASAVRDAIDLP